MSKNTNQNANRDAISGWEDEGGAGRSGRCNQAEDLGPERRDRRGDDAAPRRPNDEVPANRREDPRNEGRDQDIERKDRRSSS